MDAMQALLDRIGRQFRQGSLRFESDDGRAWTFGSSEPCARIALHRAAALPGMLLNARLRLGQGYMEGMWTPLDGNLLHTLEVMMIMLGSVRTGPVARWLTAGLNRLRELNTPTRSRRNVSHHYDLDYRLYAAFLDRDLHYSCAYFREPGLSLEAAQQAKCAHIAAKLDLRRGMRVLDIGCGWGSLALYLAQHHEVHVTGITLSQEQLGIARQRAAERGLERLTDFRLQDYRLTTGQFDAVVSVGMFEHVGRPQYDVFFRQCAQRLKGSGTLLLHTIGRISPPAATNPWIRKYIFPGGYLPAASEILAAIERRGLFLTDLEVWRLHYADTLAHWNQRFQARRAEFCDRTSERFCRMWEFYLLSAEAGFRWGDLVVYQVQLTHDRHRLPQTRDYLYEDGSR